MEKIPKDLKKEQERILMAKKAQEILAESRQTIRQNVGLVIGNEWLSQCDRIPKIEQRTSMTLSLIKSYKLLPKLKLIHAKKATRTDLEAFHTKEYLDYCEKSRTSDDLERLDINSEKTGRFGMEYDCPLIRDIMTLIQWVAGGSLAAAESLNTKECKIAINWGGGWHHGQRDEASGFCYVNDIVLAIQHLRKVYDKVLYVDLDVHHGDGVENAFAFTPKVFTFSIHKYEPGYFPGTGNINDVGQGRGKYYSLNVPLKDGIDDHNYEYLFNSLFSEITYAFKPDAIVVQCGADCLTNDPLGGFNLTPKGIANCVNKIVSKSLPTLVLGGGGYNKANSARFWTYLTGILISNEDLAVDIPDDDPYFTKYGPSFELTLTPGRRPNLNSSESLNDLLEEAFRNLDEIP